MFYFGAIWDIFCSGLISSFANFRNYILILAPVNSCIEYFFEKTLCLYNTYRPQLSLGLKSGGLPGSSSPGLNTEMKVLASLASSLEALEENPLLSLFRFLAEFSPYSCRAEVPISVLAVHQQPFSAP